MLIDSLAAEYLHTEDIVKLFKHAARIDWLDMCRHLLSISDINDFFVPIPRDPAGAVYDRYDILGQAMSKGVVELLLDRGAPPCLFDKSIEGLCRQGQVGAVKMLVERGALKTLIERSALFPSCRCGWNLLLVALYKENEPVFRFLVQHGAVIQKGLAEAVCRRMRNEGIESMCVLLWEERGVVVADVPESRVNQGNFDSPFLPWVSTRIATEEETDICVDEYFTQDYDVNSNRAEDNGHT